MDCYISDYGAKRRRLNRNAGLICYTPMKTIKFPKFKDEALVDVVIQRGGFTYTDTAAHVRCQKQTIEGVEIPEGFDFWYPAQGGQYEVFREYSSRPFVHVPGWKMNELLRSLIIRKLKNK